MKLSRFSFVLYDDEANSKQLALRDLCKKVEAEITDYQAGAITPNLDAFFLNVSNTANLPEYKEQAIFSADLAKNFLLASHKSAALIQLEIVYFFAGKAIRADQIERSPNQ